VNGLQEIGGRFDLARKAWLFIEMIKERLARHKKGSTFDFLYGWLGFSQAYT